MNKVALLLSCLVVIATAAIIPLNGSSAANTTICKYQDQLWGSEDGTRFYFCLTINNTAIEQKCPEETFFVRNATLTGCVPNDMMNPNCVNNVVVGDCTGLNLQQPQPSTDPDKFYLCPSEGATPLLLSCAAGKGFIKQDGYLGCFNWTQWRVLRQCNTLTNQIC
ncbi:uncharacterized protein [Eurosta solidaginis]|uniref:uncharacterized protein n=1 Tax=Eurosta solidaginis TaxID=178769 RepID=UPI0035310203